MIKLRKSDDRAHANHGWLVSQHTFSFANYYDPDFMGFSDLRVINEDRIKGGQGFGKHAHDNMEIISYVISGKLQHKDSMGTIMSVNAGDVQIMSAGTGVQHSEYNALANEETHFLQIWILPEKRNISPRYAQSNFTDRMVDNNLTLVCSKTGRDGALLINQDVDLYIGKLRQGEKLQLPLTIDRCGWIQMIKGTLKLQNFNLASGDGLSLEKEENIELICQEDAEFLFFNLRNL